MTNKEKIKILRSLKGTIEQKEVAFEILKDAPIAISYNAKPGEKSVSISDNGEFLFLSCTLVLEEEKDELE